METLIRNEKMVNFERKILRGDVFYADMSGNFGSEQGGIRPVIIIQNDIGNKYSPTVIVSAITSQVNKAKLPTHISLDKNKYGLDKDSVVMLEQLRTLDKKRLKGYICSLDSTDTLYLDKALNTSLGINQSIDVDMLIKLCEKSGMSINDLIKNNYPQAR